MIMINNDKEEATAGLKKPPRQKRVLGYIKKCSLLMGGVQVDGGVLVGWGDECLKNRHIMRGDGERRCCCKES